MKQVRTCIGCRTRSEKSSLVRLVQRHGSVVVDVKGVLEGRGSWVHATLQCFDGAVSRKALSRAFRSPVTNIAEARDYFEHLSAPSASAPTSDKG